MLNKLMRNKDVLVERYSAAKKYTIESGGVADASSLCGTNDICTGQMFTVNQFKSTSTVQGNNADVNDSTYCCPTNTFLRQNESLFGCCSNNMMFNSNETCVACPIHETSPGNIEDSNLKQQQCYVECTDKSKSYYNKTAYNECGMCPGYYEDVTPGDYTGGDYAGGVDGGYVDVTYTKKYEWKPKIEQKTGENCELYGESHNRFKYNDDVGPSGNEYTECSYQGLTNIEANFDCCKDGYFQIEQSCFKNDTCGVPYFLQNYSDSSDNNVITKVVYDVSQRQRKCSAVETEGDNSCVTTCKESIGYNSNDTIGYECLTCDNSDYSSIVLDDIDDKNGCPESQIYSVMGSEFGVCCMNPDTQIAYGLYTEDYSFNSNIFNCCNSNYYAYSDISDNNIKCKQYSCLEVLEDEVINYCLFKNTFDKLLIMRIHNNDFDCKLTQTNLALHLSNHGSETIKQNLIMNFPKNEGEYDSNLSIAYTYPLTDADTVYRRYTISTKSAGGTGVTIGTGGTGNYNIIRIITSNEIERHVQFIISTLGDNTDIITVITKDNRNTVLQYDVGFDSQTTDFQKQIIISSRGFTSYSIYHNVYKLINILFDTSVSMIQLFEIEIEIENQNTIIYKSCTKISDPSYKHDILYLQKIEKSNDTHDWSNYGNDTYIYIFLDTSQQHIGTIKRMLDGTYTTKLIDSFETKITAIYCYELSDTSYGLYIIFKDTTVLYREFDADFEMVISKGKMFSTLNNSFKDVFMVNSKLEDNSGGNIDTLLLTQDNFLCEVMPNNVVKRLNIKYESSNIKYAKQILLNYESKIYGCIILIIYNTTTNNTMIFIYGYRSILQYFFPDNYMLLEDGIFGTANEIPKMIYISTIEEASIGSKFILDYVIRDSSILIYVYAYNIRTITIRVCASDEFIDIDNATMAINCSSCAADVTCAGKTCYTINDRHCCEDSKYMSKHGRCVSCEDCSGNTFIKHCRDYINDLDIVDNGPLGGECVSCVCNPNSSLIAPIDFAYEPGLTLFFQSVECDGTDRLWPDSAIEEYQGTCTPCAVTTGEYYKPMPPLEAAMYSNLCPPMEALYNVCQPNMYIHSTKQTRATCSTPLLSAEDRTECCTIQCFTSISGNECGPNFTPSPYPSDQADKNGGCHECKCELPNTPYNDGCSEFAVPPGTLVGFATVFLNNAWQLAGFANWHWKTYDISTEHNYIKVQNTWRQDAHHPPTCNFEHVDDEKSDTTDGVGDGNETVYRRIVTEGDFTQTTGKVKYKDADWAATDFICKNKKAGNGDWGYTFKEWDADRWLAIRENGSDNGEIIWSSTESNAAIFQFYAGAFEQ
jgi:hypothetical protein